MENSSWLTEGCSPRLRCDDSEGIGGLSQMLLRQDGFPSTGTSSHTASGLLVGNGTCVPHRRSPLVDKVAGSEIRAHEFATFSEVQGVFAIWIITNAGVLAK